MKAFVRELIYGVDGKPSLVNTVTAVGFLVFIVVTLYLVLAGQYWEGYPVFAGITGGGSLVGKVSDKYINNVCVPKIGR